jgi:hypothetical protein
MRGVRMPSAASRRTTARTISATKANVISRRSTLERTSHGGSGVRNRAATAITRMVRLSSALSTKIVPSAELMGMRLFFVIR